ncbi:MAG: restriction endonuclease subunit S [Acutalibacter sp.]
MRVKLGEVCKVVSGTTPKSSCPEYWNGTLNWVTPAELKDDSDIVYETERKITLRAVQDTGLKPFPIGTVLLSSRAPIGKVAISGTEMYCNQGFKNLVCSGSIYNRYLYHFLKDKTEYLNALGRGATFKEISKDIVENIEIPLPPLETQRHIAAVLDKVSALIAKRRQQLDKLDELVKSRFMEMFGDPQSNPHGYQYAKLSDIATYFNGLTYKPENVAEEGTIVLRSSNIQNSQLDFADTVRVDCAIKKRLMVQENDILMCSRNGSAKLVGKVALIKGIQEPMSFGAFMMIIRSQYFGYLMTYFQMDAFRQQIKTGATTTINQITGRMLDDVTIPLPPMALVEQFAAFVAQTDKAKLAIQKGLEKLETLKKALMQEYFG